MNATQSTSDTMVVIVCFDPATGQRVQTDPCAYSVALHAATETSKRWPKIIHYLVPVGATRL